MHIEKWSTLSWKTKSPKNQWKLLYKTEQWLNFIDWYSFWKDNCLAVVARGYNKDINFTILSCMEFILLNAFKFRLNEADFLYLLISLIGFNGINKKLQYMFGNWNAKFFLAIFDSFPSVTSVRDNFDDKSFCWLKNTSQENFCNLELLV